MSTSRMHVTCTYAIYYQPQLCRVTDLNIISWQVMPTTWSKSGPDMGNKRRWPFRRLAMRGPPPSNSTLGIRPPPSTSRVAPLRFWLMGALLINAVYWNPFPVVYSCKSEQGQANKPRLTDVIFIGELRAAQPTACVLCVYMCTVFLKFISWRTPLLTWEISVCGQLRWQRTTPTHLLNQPLLLQHYYTLLYYYL